MRIVIASLICQQAAEHDRHTSERQEVCQEQDLAHGACHCIFASPTAATLLLLPQYMLGLAATVCLPATACQPKTACLRLPRLHHFTPLVLCYAGLLHTIIFNRALGQVRPIEVESWLDLAYVRACTLHLRQHALLLSVNPQPFYLF